MSQQDPRHRQGNYVEYGNHPGHLTYGEDSVGGMLIEAVAVVNPANPAAEDDGDLSTPFVTVQNAVDALPSAGGSVLVTPQPDNAPYEETVIIDKPDVHLMGLGSDIAPLPLIQPSDADMPAVIITNATRASALVWAADPANYLANYGVLADAGEPHPTGVTISDMSLIGQSLAAYALVLAGVGGDTLSANTSRVKLGLGSSGAVWSKSANLGVALTTVSGRTWFFDDAILLLEHSTIGRVTAQNASTIGAKMSSIGTGGGVALLLDGSGFTGRSVDFLGDVDIDNGANYQHYGGTIEGAALTTLEVEGDCQADIYNVHVEGLATYENAAPLQACIAHGGAFVPNYSDGGARLTRVTGF